MKEAVPLATLIASSFVTAGTPVVADVVPLSVRADPTVASVKSAAFSKLQWPTKFAAGTRGTRKADIEKMDRTVFIVECVFFGRVKAEFKKHLDNFLILFQKRITANSK
jgi:hypothetical protein